MLPQLFTFTPRSFPHLLSYVLFHCHFARFTCEDALLLLYGLPEFTSPPGLSPGIRPHITFHLLLNVPSHNHNHLPNVRNRRSLSFSTLWSVGGPYRRDWSQPPPTPYGHSTQFYSILSMCPTCRLGVRAGTRYEPHSSTRSIPGYTTLSPPTVPECTRCVTWTHNAPGATSLPVGGKSRQCYFIPPTAGPLWLCRSQHNVRKQMLNFPRHY